MSVENIRDLLSIRETLQGRAQQARNLIQSMDTIENNIGHLMGNLGNGKVYIDRHLAAEIAATHLADIEAELAKIEAKVEAINTLLAD